MAVAYFVANSLNIFTGLPFIEEHNIDNASRRVNLSL